MKPLSRLDREAVKTIYFRADTEQNVGAIEVSWDDGVTWTALTAATDPDAQDAYTLTVSGPQSGSTAGRVLTLGRNRGLVRIVDNPEIEVHRFSIDCT
jgi:hypothetical protein